MSLLETPLENILIPLPINKKWLTNQEMEQYQSASLILKQAEIAGEACRKKARQAAAQFLWRKRLSQRQRQARWTTQHKSKLAAQASQLEELAERRLNQLLETTVQWQKNETELEKEVLQNTLCRAKEWLLSALNMLSAQIDWTPKVNELVEAAMAEFAQTKIWTLWVAEAEHDRLSKLLAHHTQLEVRAQSELQVGCAILHSSYVRIHIEASKGYQKLIDLLEASRSSNELPQYAPEQTDDTEPNENEPIEQTDGSEKAVEGPSTSALESEEAQEEKNNDALEWGEVSTSKT